MKKFMVLNIIAFKSGTTNSATPEQDTCRRQSMCYETALKCNRSLKEIFSKSRSLRVMKNMMTVLSWRLYNSLGPFNMLTLKGCSESVFFTKLSNQVFDGL